MKYAIEVLENELKTISLKEDDDEDIYDAVLSFRKTTHVKLAIKYLKQFQENNKEYNDLGNL